MSGGLLPRVTLTQNLSDYFSTANLPSLTSALPCINMTTLGNMMPNIGSVAVTARPKKTWEQLKDSVRMIHKRVSDVSSPVPFIFNFRPIAEKRTRIYFLSSSANSSETSLFYADVDEEKIDNGSAVRPIYPCTSLMDTDLDSEAKLSFAEAIKDHGIVTLSNVPSCSSTNSRLSNVTDPVGTTLSANNVIFDWKPLLEPTFKRFRERETDPNATKLNHEEKLQLERKRIMFTGITSYEYDMKTKRFVFSSGGNLFFFDDVLTPPYSPIRLETQIRGAKINPQMCPANSDLVAYVADGDIWAVNIRSGHEVRLTNTRARRTAETAISAGLPSYVLQEEFRRYCGFWWRPESEYHHCSPPDEMTPGDSSDRNRLMEYEILYEEVDETGVETVKIPSWDGNVEEYRFPRPGTKNAVSSLKLVSFKLDTTTNQIVEIKTRDVPGLECLKTFYDEFEYLARCGWQSCDTIWVQLLNRKQNHLVLGLVSLSHSFPPQVIYREWASGYVNVSDVLHFINGGLNETLRSGSDVSFVWTSEDTGFRHIYVIKVRLRATADEEDTATDESRLLRRGPGGPCEDYEQRTFSVNVGYGGTLTSALIERTQLTFGQWEVSDKDVWVDEWHGLIYFVGLRETPMEKHLYVIPMDSIMYTIPIKRLTDDGFSHTTIAFDPNYSMYVNVQSNVSIPPFGYINKLTRTNLSKCNSPVKKVTNALLPDVKKLGLIMTNVLQPPDQQSDQMDQLPGLSKPIIFTYQLKSSGDLIYGLVFKPEFMEPGVKYPCLLDIYGGPEVQVVSNSFKGVRHVRRHLLSNEGYVVVAFDCRGSRNRGTKFESHIRHRMGQVEINDQVEVLTWLEENTGFIDMSRIAVHGWSYGGYLSLMAIAQRPDMFKLCIAGAPVTNWCLYDTGYTERYMDVPSANPEGYARGNVINYINKFPNEENRLLIIHGLIDENVHFIHTVELIQALIRAGKPYQLQIYPYERHSLRNSPCCEHYETCLLSYLQQHL